MEPTDHRQGALSVATESGVFHEQAAAEPPFVVIEPLRRTAPLIFASPHSGRRYPPELLADARVGLLSLRRSEDAYVDELFAGAAAHGATLLTATIARAYVDLNRDPGELDPDMFDERPPSSVLTASARVQAGLGAIPRVCGDGQNIYRRKLSLHEAEKRLAMVHRPYHATLQRLLGETREQFGCAVLIDCHSMPNSSRGAHAPDIVLGDRFGASCHPSVTALAEARLRRLGYRVARNTPFAGGHITQSYGRPMSHVHALQIEINRALYVDERTLERTNGHTRVRADMSRLAEALNAASLHQSLV
ncbi:MAG TPA: N-formylglutamate amidohydrolase [Vitreimonas sp.]|uniref:N-formylglutamate amidohydrolase n=1 Tax=Vitreimonas sp. TaxID=3069702 RepID=UPI002D46CEC6|nr:N-formylglutamate amidohydrolase [Vitreimonas sp.]HYD89842.1 N-formylglutamate amidohydrolase [Vitreimonas sp.]